jgi:hypothetical protein
MTTRTQKQMKHKVCFLCGRGMVGKSHLHPQRPIAYRVVESFGGRRPKGWRKWPASERAKLKPVGFHVVRTVYLDELRDSELHEEVERIVARLALAVGLPRAEQVVREVVKKQVVYRIPEAFKARAKQWQQAAAKWAAHCRAQERRSYEVRNRQVEDGGRVRESFNGRSYEVRDRKVIDGGRQRAGW